MRTVVRAHLATLGVLAALAMLPIAFAGGEKPKQGGKGGGADLKVIKGKLDAKDKFDKVRQQMYCKIYPVKLLAGNSYQIDMKSGDFDSYLRLEDPDGNTIAEDDDGGGFPDARIIQDIGKTGVYKVIATSFGANSTGDFVVEIKGKGVGEAVAETGGGEKKTGGGDGGSKTIKGQLTKDDPEYKNRKGSLHKAFTHKFQKGQDYQIDLVSSDFDSYLYLEDPDGKVVAEDDDGGGFPNAQIKIKAETSGNYKIVATTFKAGDTGAFTLTIKGGAGEEKVGKEEKGAKALKLNALTKSEINDKDKGYKNRNNHFHKVFTLKMQADQTYVITMRSDDFDSYLFLEDGAGKVLAQDDDTGGGNTGLDAQISFNCTKAGTYRIITTTFAEGATGNFTIEAKGDEKKGDKGDKGATVLKLNALTKSKIANDDKGYKNRNNHLHKVFTMKMEADKTYVITMRSDDFDSYLFLEDGAGKVLAQDDDTGGGNTGLDAQISFNCTKAGTYRIITTTYAADATGDFTIEARQQKE